MLSHLSNNRKPLVYARMMHHGLDFGSGAAEGAVRNLVRLRLDSPGRQWGRGRDERVLHLRSVLLNSQWGQLIDFAESKTVKLPPRPVPAQAHDAKKKAG